MTTKQGYKKAIWQMPSQGQASSVHLLHDMQRKEANKTNIPASCVTALLDNPAVLHKLTCPTLILVLFTLVINDRTRIRGSRMLCISERRWC